MKASFPCIILQFQIIECIAVSQISLLNFAHSKLNSTLSSVELKHPKECKSSTIAFYF